MKKNDKSELAYKTIGEVAKELDLIDKKTGNIQTHTIRYWETQFRQIRPSLKAGKRRYYSSKDFKMIQYVKFLLKEKGLTINGVKKILNANDELSIDENASLGIYKQDLNTTKVIKDKVKKISKIAKELKKITNG